MSGGGRQGDELVAARRGKHADTLSKGGYPPRYERTHTAGELRRLFGGLAAGTETDQRVSVAGRLMLSRSFGKLGFGTVADHTGTIQLLVDQAGGPDLMERFTDLDLGDWVGAEGTVMTTRKGELSVRVASLVLLRKALRPLPDKWHGLADVELRSRRRYLDLIVNEDARRVALARARIVSALREEFEGRGFIEVETPVLLTQATGALARPFETHHNALDIPLQLRIATELYLKRLVVGGLERVFEIGRIFRNEGVDATHSPEFTMLEAYQALADYRDIMMLVEEVLVGVVEEVQGSPRLSYQGRELSFELPFRRVSMIDLVSGHLGVDVGLDTPGEELRTLLAGAGGSPDPAWGPGKLLFELYEIALRSVWEPTIVMDFPHEVSPLARPHRDDDRLTERFLVVIAGAEYCNAFSELNDPDTQRARFEAQAASRAAGDSEAHTVDEDYLVALEYGLPPTGGLGIGVDRLVMLLTDRPHIREVILFPTLRPEGSEEE